MASEAGEESVGPLAAQPGIGIHSSIVAAEGLSNCLVQCRYARGQSISRTRKSMIVIMDLRSYMVPFGADGAFAPGQTGKIAAASRSLLFPDQLLERTQVQGRIGPGRGTSPLQQAIALGEQGIESIPGRDDAAFMDRKMGVQAKRDQRQNHQDQECGQDLHGAGGIRRTVAASTSDIDVLGTEGSRLDKFATRLDLIAHQGGEDFVGTDGIFDPDLEQAAGFGVHGGVPKLVGIHLA